MEIKDIAAYITSAYRECSVYVYDTVPSTFAREDVSAAVNQFGQLPHIVIESIITELTKRGLVNKNGSKHGITYTKKSPHIKPITPSTRTITAIRSVMEVEKAIWSAVESKRVTVEDLVSVYSVSRTAASLLLGNRCYFKNVGRGIYVRVEKPKRIEDTPNETQATIDEMIVDVPQPQRTIQEQPNVLVPKVPEPITNIMEPMDKARQIIELLQGMPVDDIKKAMTLVSVMTGVKFV